MQNTVKVKNNELQLRANKGKYRNLLLNNVVWVLLILSFLVIGIMKPVFFSSRILGNVLTQATVLGVLSFAQSQAIMLGAIDLSLIGTMTFAATVGTLAIQKGVPVPIGIVLILATGLLIGIINGLLVAKLKAVALIETLAMKIILLGSFMAITQGRSVINFPESYKLVGQGSIFGIPIMPIFLFLIFILVYILWNKTPIGRSLYAVGGNANAAHVSGINVDLVVIFAFAFAGLLAGFAGYLLSGYMGAVTSTFGISFDMNCIAASVIGGVQLSGGRGTAQGIFGGVLLLTVIQVGLQILGVSSFYVQMASGLIIFVAVIIDAIRLKVQG